MQRARKYLRLRKYDYSSDGYYFVTICAKNRVELFGTVVDGKMVLNGWGKMAEMVWESLPDHHNVNLDVFQIMPNHIHFVVNIPVCRGFARKTPTFQNVTSGSLSCIVRSFKSEITKSIRLFENNSYIIIFQRNYYDHIIRNEKSLMNIREYIRNNPLKWNLDEENPNNFKPTE